MYLIWTKVPFLINYHMPWIQISGEKSSKKNHISFFVDLFCENCLMYDHDL